MIEELKQAAQQAFEALKFIRRQLKSWDEGDNTIAALERALTATQPAQAAQVPGKAAVAEAVKEAVAAIYFADSADYKPALWSVVKALAPDLAEMLDTNGSGAYHQADARLTAAQQGAEQAKGEKE